MLTPALEKLVWCGEAKVRAVTVGGTQKMRLRVPNNHFIVILRMIHFPYIPDEEDVPDQIDARRITQMNVSDAKSFNSFVFRNDVGLDIFFDGIGFQNYLRTGSPVSIDTYLIHDTDVSFSFSLGTEFGTTLSAPAPEKAPATNPPQDYGKIGLVNPTGNIPVSNLRTMGFGSFSELRPFQDLTPPTEPSSFSSLQFPIIGGITALTDDNIQGRKAYPIVQVQYVEVKGQSQDLESNN